MKTVYTWAGFFAIVTVAIYLEGGKIGTYVQPTAALLVFGPQVFFLFMSLGRDGAEAFFRRCVSGAPSSADMLMLSRLETLSYFFGGIGMATGLIHVMMHLSNSSRIGAGTAVCFVSFLYALIVPVMAHSIPNAVEISEASASMETRRKRAAGFVLVGVLGILFAFCFCLMAIKIS